MESANDQLHKPRAQKRDLGRILYNFNKMDTVSWEKIWALKTSRLRLFLKLRTALRLFPKFKLSPKIRATVQKEVLKKEIQKE